MKIPQACTFAILLTGFFCLGGCVTSEQLKSPSAGTVMKKVEALKTNKSALIAYLKATNIRYTVGPVDMTNKFWMDKFTGHAGLSQNAMSSGDILVSFSKATFPFDTPMSLTGTPTVDGQVVYDRHGRYVGSYIFSGLAGI